MVVKINFFLLCQAQIFVLATRARVTLTFDWLAFAVYLFWRAAGQLRKVLTTIEKKNVSFDFITKTTFNNILMLCSKVIFNLFSLDKSYNCWIFDLKVLHL